MLENGTPVVIVGPEGWDGQERDYKINGRTYHINDLMREYIGQKTRIVVGSDQRDDWYTVEDNNWWWHETWLKFDNVNIDDNELEEMLL